MTKKSKSNTVEVIPLTFNPDVLVITPVAAGLKLGNKPRTTYNQLSTNSFPLPIVKVGRRKMVRLNDLYTYVNNLTPISAAEVPATIDSKSNCNQLKSIELNKNGIRGKKCQATALTKRGSGRPTNVSINNLGDLS